MSVYYRGAVLLVLGLIALIVAGVYLAGLANLVVLIVGIVLVIAGALDLIFGYSRGRGRTRV